MPSSTVEPSILEAEVPGNCCSIVIVGMSSVFAIVVEQQQLQRRGCGLVCLPDESVIVEKVFIVLSAEETVLDRHGVNTCEAHNSFVVDACPASGCH